MVAIRMDMDIKGKYVMKKKFNDTGLCTPDRHYMVDISPKIDQITQLVEAEDYFSINRPRQFGKTTILSHLARTLNQGEDCIAMSISLEDMDAVTCRGQEDFIWFYPSFSKR